MKSEAISEEEEAKKKAVYYQRLLINIEKGKTS